MEIENKEISLNYEDVALIVVALTQLSDDISEGDCEAVLNMSPKQFDEFIDRMRTILHQQ